MTGSIFFRLALYFVLIAITVSCSRVVLDAEEVSTIAIETRTPELGAPDVESIEFAHSGNVDGMIQAIVRGKLPDDCSVVACSSLCFSSFFIASTAFLLYWFFTISKSSSDNLPVL